MNGAVVLICMCGVNIGNEGFCIWIKLIMSAFKNKKWISWFIYGNQKNSPVTNFLYFCAQTILHSGAVSFP
jgi:hypothetical protein